MATNITLAVDPQLVARVREVARQQGTSLNVLVREHLERLAGQRTGAEIFRSLAELWAEGSGHSGGRKPTREDAYEDSLG
jgi:hypothetical protein